MQVKKSKLPSSKIFQDLDTDRTEMLERVRKCSKLTLSHILPDSDHKESDIFEQKYTSFVSRGINSLASKLRFSVLPPSISFFKLKPDKQIMDDLKDDNDKKNKIEQNLIYIENQVLDFIKTMNYGAKLVNVFKHLIVSGNCLIEFVSGDDKELFLKTYRLDKYVIKRTKSDILKHIIIKESSYIYDLPDNYRQIADNNCDRSKNKNNNIIKLYTNIKYNINTKKYDKWIEFEDGTIIEESKKSYKKKIVPFLHLRWNSIDDENYGRGMIEEYYGDVASYEAINQYIQEFAAAASKIIHFVDPNSDTSEIELNNAVSGDFILGKATDVTTLQSAQNADFNIVDKVRVDLKQDLSQSFMMADSIRRDAERVTAKEIQIMANELESSLGGTYSMLSLDFQVPFVNILMDHLKINLDEKYVKASIITGLESVGRNIELQKLNTFLQVLSEVPPEELQKINFKNVILKYANYIGIDIGGLYKTYAELSKEQQVRMAQEAVQNQMALEQQNQQQKQNQAQKQQGGK